jgi:hypothetical protein
MSKGLTRKTPLRAKTGLKATKWSKGKKSARQTAISRADRLLQRAVLARDKGICQKCGNVASEGHHIVHRRYYSLRWDMANVVSLCRECHSLDGTIRRPELTDFCIRWVGGIDAMTALRLRAHEDASETPEQAIERLNAHINTDTR